MKNWLFFPHRLCHWCNMYFFFFHFILYRFIFSLNFSHKCRNSTKPPFKKKPTATLKKPRGKCFCKGPFIFPRPILSPLFYYYFFFFNNLGEKRLFVRLFFLSFWSWNLKKKIAGFSYVVLCTGESIYVKPCLIRKKQLTPHAAN